MPKKRLDITLDHETAERARRYTERTAPPWHRQGWPGSREVPTSSSGQVRRLKLLLHINVLLDVLLDREPWSEAASEILSTIESEKVQGFVAPHTLPTIYYVIAQSQDRNVAAGAVTDLLRILDAPPLTKSDYQEALALPITDFGDALQATAAFRIGADDLVTRNERDYRGATVPISDPATVLALIQ
jgi:predicted nucleic acid-binding protein